MIASLDGVVAEIRGDSVVMVVGGVGLQVFAPTGTIASLRAIGQRARLHTHLHFAQDVIALYGFATQEELRLFKLLLEVSGVGPRNALRMLSTLSPKQLAAAIASGDEAALSRTPGIGKKLAARVVLELKGALEKEWSLAGNGAAIPAAPIDTDALAALTALGYTAAEARDALAALGDTKGLKLEDKVTQALQRMGRG